MTSLHGRTFGAAQRSCWRPPPFFPARRHLHAWGPPSPVLPASAAWPACCERRLLRPCPCNRAGSSTWGWGCTATRGRFPPTRRAWARPPPAPAPPSCARVSGKACCSCAELVALAAAQRACTATCAAGKGGRTAPNWQPATTALAALHLTVAAAPALHACRPRGLHGLGRGPARNQCGRSGKGRCGLLCCAAAQQAGGAEAALQLACSPRAAQPGCANSRPQRPTAARSLLPSPAACRRVCAGCCFHGRQECI